MATGPEAEFQELMDAWSEAIVADDPDDKCRPKYDRRTERGVMFTYPPTVLGDVTQAVFDDTCREPIQVVDSC